MSTPQEWFGRLRYDGVVVPELAENFPFLDMTSPEMPIPGESFVTAARHLGDPEIVIERGRTAKDVRLVEYGKNLHFLYRRALYDPNFAMRAIVGARTVETQMVPGHLFGVRADSWKLGPMPAHVMVIGKNPGAEEVAARRNFVGPTSEELWDGLRAAGTNELDWQRWYLDNIVKWPQLDKSSSTLPKGHLRDNAILLEQTLRMVLPSFILCLGSEASKWVLSRYGQRAESGFGVEAMDGRVEELLIPTYFDGEEPAYHTAKVMTARHPASVYRDPSTRQDFVDQLSQFVAMSQGVDILAVETELEHPVVYTESHLARIIDEILADPDPQRRILAVDAEWHGEYPEQAGAYLRTIQFSSRHKQGVCVVLRHQGGQPAFKPGVSAAIRQLKRLLLPHDGWQPRIGGHYLRADLPWLEAAGLPIRELYAPPERHELCRTEGGWELGLAYHAVRETDRFNLTAVSRKLTKAPVYDRGLKSAITSYCAENNITKKDLEGFGFLGSWVLHPVPGDPEWGENYAQYDADVTRRGITRLMEPGGLLDSDDFNQAAWEPYWRSHRASLGVLEMEEAGFVLDKARVDELTRLYDYCDTTLLDAFRKEIGWADFNPASSDQCVALLFGEQYLSAKKGWETPQRLRPEGVECFNFTPIKSTERSSPPWARLEASGEARYKTPSTDKEVLGILSEQDRRVKMLRDVKFLRRVLSSALRRPDEDDYGDVLRDDDDEFMVYSEGASGAVRESGKVHTHVFMDKETGRSSSARYPLQNFANKRETDYARILGVQTPDGPKGDYLNIFGGPLYRHPIRSIFRARPGHVFVEADYIGAELAMIAWLSGDPTMIEHVRRNSLPEDHPDYYDIHSQKAVSAFKLSCEPTKKALKAAGLIHLRIAAKAVVFGIPYGRGVEALVRQCREEGADVSQAECAQLIEQYYTDYSLAGEFLAECERRVSEYGFIYGTFGRLRRFYPARDEKTLAEQIRQAKNFPIQNGVADAIWSAVYNLRTYRKQNPGLYNLEIQIHDAVMFEVPVDRLVDFIGEDRNPDGSFARPSVLRQLMSFDVPIYPRRLDGSLMPVAQPYYFGIDTKVMVNWGVSIPQEVWSDISKLQQLVV